MTSTAQRKRLIWWLDTTEGDPGFTWERWSPGTGGSGTTAAAFETAWAGPPGPDGIPTHTAGAPTQSGVETDTRYGQSAAQGENAQDESRLCFWVHNDSTVPIELLDTDTRAESLRVYAGCDCPAVLVEERYQQPQGGPYTSGGVPFLTLPPGGLTKLTVLIHDPGAYSGFRLRARNVGSTTTFDPTSYQGRPVVGCGEICDSECDPYVLETNESFKPISLNCHDCGGAGGGGLSEQEILDLVGPHTVDTDTDTRLEIDPKICPSTWGSTRRGYHRRLGYGGQILPTTTTWVDLGPVTDGTYRAECDGLAHVTFSIPWGRSIMRDSFLQAYVSYRVLVNGAVVGTANYPNDVLWEYVAPESDENNRLEYDDHQAGASWYVPVSAGDLVAVEWTVSARRIGAYPGTPYTRIMIYRRHFSAHVIPATVESIATSVEVVT